MTVSYLIHLVAKIVSYLSYLFAMTVTYVI